MHRRVLKSLAPLVGAAALVAAPIAFAAPASAAVIEPDGSIPFDADLLDPLVWEEILSEEDGIATWCEAFDEIPTPVDIPEIEDIFEFDKGDDPADFGYFLAVLSPFIDSESQEKSAVHEVYFEPSAGDELEHASGKNGEVILCIAEFEDEPEVTPSVTPTVKPSVKPSPKPTVTGPVVETDRVADTGATATLGLAAGATAFVAGAGAVLVGRRRQGSHR